MSEASTSKELSSKELLSSVITAVMSGKQSERDAACLKLQGHILSVESERDRLRAALERIANGDPSKVYSPIGPLHAAGIVFQWETDAKIAREALAHEPGEKHGT